MSGHGLLRPGTMFGAIARVVGCGGVLLGFALLTPAYLVSSVRAQSSGGAYGLNPHAMAGGGGRSTSGVFDLHGSIGQHDASNLQNGGVFALTGGFQRRAAGAPANEVFRDGFE